MVQPKPIVLYSHLAPGDATAMTACVRDLHINHPSRFITGVDTNAMSIWDHNPYVTKFEHDKLVLTFDEESKESKERLVDYKLLKDIWDSGRVPVVSLNYTDINKSHLHGYHFTDAFTNELEKVLNIKISNRTNAGDIYLSDEEKGWISQVEEYGHSGPYWIVVNGGKSDFTAKHWDPHRMQQVVNSMPHLMFVQVGEMHHMHTPLRGHNVINLLGKTDTRQVIRLVHNSSGVISPVTFLMHLAAAVPVKADTCYGLKKRPCVVIAGGREPARWEAYNNHAYLHTCGQMTCCDSGGCWKSRVVMLGDGDDKDKDLCIFPVRTENNVIIPECLNRISVKKVIDAIESYLP